MPIGLLRTIGQIDYTGIDIHIESVQWCRKYIESLNPNYKFRHLNIHNERYNPKGVALDESFRFEFKENSFDIIFLFSVFSHTSEEDLKIYLKEFKRILSPSGIACFTTYVEEDVANFTENPKNYLFECSGPLHVVRYEKNYLFSILEEAGFKVIKFDHASEIGKQSGVYITKR